MLNLFWPCYLKYYDVHWSMGPIMHCARCGILSFQLGTPGNTANTNNVSEVCDVLILAPGIVWRLSHRCGRLSASVIKLEDS